MAKRRLLWQLYPTFLAVTLTALLGVGWYASHALEEFYVDRVREGLFDNATVLAEQVGSQLFDADLDRLQSLCQSLGKASSANLMLVSRTGLVVCDSHRPRDEWKNEKNRDEIAQALTGQSQNLTRFEPALGERVAVVAIPVVRGGVVGVVHAWQSIADIDRQLLSLQHRLLTVGIVISIATAVVGWWGSRQITEPITAMREGAERFARGELGYQLHIAGSDEFAGLSGALNSMAEQLQERIATIVRQNNEQRAVLGSMSEGVLAIDNDERVISVNAAFGHLLGVDDQTAQGRSLQEIVRNADLRRFAARALACKTPVEDVVALHGEDQGVLQARAAALHDAGGAAVGAVIVLNDVTHFRRLENIRRDFVANVSHELKTPVTAIKGSAETLLDGALDQPDDARKFCEIIAKQAERMHAIIEDLLSLSKIEQGEEKADLALEKVPVLPVLQSAVHDCDLKATERNVQVRLACPDDLEARLNPPLLGQAVINLLDNAIKYCEPGSEVQVLGAVSNAEVTISVADQGVGIAAEHLPRIFERFYRVDKARSRKLGGTGLGLAIVKHIVQAHRGRVTVKSTPGVGSTFVIHLPQA